MRSLRARLLAGTVLASAAVLSAAGLAVYLTARSHLVGQFDKGLEDKARLLASTLEYEHGKVELDDDLDMSEFAGTVNPAYLQLWMPDGRVLFRSPSLGTGDVSCPRGTSGSSTFAWTTLPEGRRGRVLTFVHEPRVEEEHGHDTAPRITLAMARGTESVDSALAALRLLLCAVGTLAVAMSSGVLWRVVSRSLRPVDLLAAQIGDLDESVLGVPVVVPTAPAELAPVVDRLNELMGRLDAAFSRERSFSADMAHELRTPLAGLRSTLEVTLASPREADEYQRALYECLRITTQTQSLVENLLSLARLESGQQQVERKRVDLAKLTEGEWALLEDRADERGLTVRRSAEALPPVETDPVLLRVAIRNVLENAVVHANEGGEISIECDEANGCACLRVSNTGGPVADDQVEHVFDRLWRGDAARGDTGRHCGLGLALVRKIAETLGGTAEAETKEGGEFTVWILLPTKGGDVAPDGRA